MTRKRITGTVFDRTSGRPLSKVIVEAIASGARGGRMLTQSRTDNSGKYEIELQFDPGPQARGRSRSRLGIWVRVADGRRVLDQSPVRNRETGHEEIDLVVQPPSPPPESLPHAQSPGDLAEVSAMANDELRVTANESGGRPPTQHERRRVRLALGHHAQEAPGSVRRINDFPEDSMLAHSPRPVRSPNLLLEEQEVPEVEEGIYLIRTADTPIRSDYDSPTFIPQQKIGRNTPQSTPSFFPPPFSSRVIAPSSDLMCADAISVASPEEAAVSSALAKEAIFGEDDRIPYINTQWPLRTVGVVFYRKSSEYSDSTWYTLTGSGCLIHPSIAVTARHNLPPWAKDPTKDPGSIKFVLNPIHSAGIGSPILSNFGTVGADVNAVGSEEMETLEASVVVTIIPSKPFTLEGKRYRARDIAFLVLDRPIGQDVVPAPVQQGTYGPDEWGWIPPLRIDSSYQKQNRASSYFVAAVNDGLVGDTVTPHIQQGVGLWWEKFKVGRADGTISLGMQADVSDGDSGGPVFAYYWVKWDNGWVVPMPRLVGVVNGLTGVSNKVVRGAGFGPKVEGWLGQVYKEFPWLVDVQNS